MATSTQTPSTNAQDAANGSNPAEQVGPCDFRKVGGIDKARLAPLMAAGEAFARTFTQAFQGKLGLAGETTLQSSEQMPCRKFLEKAAGSYVVSLQLGAQGETALLQIDSMLLFPVVDRLLGGSGGASDLSREATDIEDQIAKDFVRLVCEELQIAWRAFHVSVAIGTRQLPSQLQLIFSATDNAIVFSFSVNMEAAGGGFQLLLPIASLGAFLGPNTSSSQDVSRKGTMNAKFAEKALDWTFELDLMLPGGKVRATDLLNLSIGKILSLGVSVRTPGVLKIGGHDVFEAVPVRSGQRRGAQLLDRMPQSQSETGNLS